MNQIERRAKGIIRKFLKILKNKNCCSEIYFVSSRKMKFLNKKFRNKNKAADVLSFPEPKNFPHPESQKKILGEIYLKSPITNYKLLTILLAHGLLHLLGFRHQKKNDRIKMEKKEKFLVSNV
jgi:probable rRNA maturation factor